MDLNFLDNSLNFILNTLWRHKNTDNSLPVLLSSWNYGNNNLLLQKKYNKTVQVQVTIIPRQSGKELSVHKKQLVVLAKKRFFFLKS